ncbi:3-deoxy-D-manno-octulosonic acid transferase [Thiomicrorhabdus sp.]|uniref:3-deoxy-D-manno-octulosonic acid transferase n=1 Tax=Thiomicrorhabdus sp. TaxID=2039724 RepID=UPI0029C904B2|nr:3-deoxy-D-manno-octulosonic acid transferase [Thiomicrorhabdus sp.]
MRRVLYQFLNGLALPVFAYSAWKRCRRYKKLQQQQSLPEIHDCFRARFGFSTQKFQTGGIWIHAVSVGETRSIFPLLEQLDKHYPDLPITLTSGSTQGAVQALKFSPVPVQHQMIPYDFGFAVKRFLKQIQPQLVIMIETEIWPNLYHACSAADIPLVLANARLKESSFQAYKKWGGKMVQDALNQTRFIAAQFPEDAEHFAQLGAEPQKIRTLGNLKFDLPHDHQLRKRAEEWKASSRIENKFIWVAASTHKDPLGGKSEEQLMLEAHKMVLKKHPDALLILVPRHADRFEEAAQLLSGSNLKWAQRSHAANIDSDIQVYLADSVGELMLWFAACNAAFIGGSMVEFGGHNILEPASLHRPVISGPHYANLQALFNTFINSASMEITKTPQALGTLLSKLADDPKQQIQLGERAYQAFSHQSGALERLLDAIDPLIHRKKPTDLS